MSEVDIDVDSENRRLAERVAGLSAQRSPIKLQFGTGARPKSDFLNFDRAISRKLAGRSWLKEHADSYFLIPAHSPLQIPDGCVDFVFHEDFIEHLPQKVQFLFLAETLRVLKPGAVHRVNTPCLEDSMRRHSKFELGAEGVYVREWDRWSHECLLTSSFLKEMAVMIGYKDVVFTAKNASTSLHRCHEIRPEDDRPDDKGNIFADLIKG